jgi:hypothetical protein
MITARSKRAGSHRPICFFVRMCGIAQVLHVAGIRRSAASRAAREMARPQKRRHAPSERNVYAVASASIILRSSPFSTFPAALRGSGWLRSQRS